MEVHIEPMIMEDEHTPLGLVVDEEQIDVHTIGSVTVFTNTCPWEMLEYNRTIWQAIGGLKERGVSY